MKLLLIVPTYNGGRLWAEAASKLQDNVRALQGICEVSLVVIDSSSADDSRKTSATFGFDVYTIPTADFNHGGTRNYACTYVEDADILAFITQDAVFDSDFSLLNIIRMFENDSHISAVCGRQIPHFDANPLATHARIFNYPSSSMVKSAKDIETFGLKVAFMSNSFAAYRRDVFDKLGGFPSNTILAEDMYLAAKMILEGYKVAYCAEAVVRHSHNYTPWEEFKRYFDTGVFHSHEPWIREKLGGVGGEGARFVISELSYLCNSFPFWIPRALFTTLLKAIAFRLGLQHRFLPLKLKRTLSMHRNFWLKHKPN